MMSASEQGRRRSGAVGLRCSSGSRRRPAVPASLTQTGIHAATDITMADAFPRLRGKGASAVGPRLIAAIGAPTCSRSARSKARIARGQMPATERKRDS